MKRRVLKPRPDWQTKVEKSGLTFHTLNGVPYWDESVCYQFTSREVDELEAATNALQELFIQATERILRDDRLSELRIPEAFQNLARKSWDRDDPSIYGRFDLSYNGNEPPKLLEYNADTPTSLLESAVTQWYWMEEVFSGEDQFNSIHERMIDRWKSIGGEEALYLACIKGSEEDLATIEYIANTAAQAGLKTDGIFVEDIGWDGREFLDLKNRPIRRVFKLYPWEWLVREEFGPHLLKETIFWIEPAWKMLWSNKAILAILWEMFPGHPNLLPTYFSSEPLGASYVRKPIFGREGANITIKNGSQTLTTDGDYGEEGFVYQAICPSSCFDGFYPILGSWLIHGESAGVGIREDVQPITGNLSRFVPHYFQP
jgi:glutathionylspermidine synthase